MSAILQSRLPHDPWNDPALSRMPGMRPVEGDWIVVDDAYEAQMAERERLLRERPADVLARVDGSREAEAELLEVALASLPAGFRHDGGWVTRPDGRRVPARGDAFGVLGALLQEDLLLLERRGMEHVLIAGLLCFPASWTLSEKIGRPLSQIHRPVPDYDASIARRVQRLMDRAPAGRPMWRANALAYERPDLHQPRREASPRETAGQARFLRSERQTVLRLPRTGAILFAVHTWVVPAQNLTAAQRRNCPVL